MAPLANGARAILDTEDGRWALVSTSVTALVAGSIAWLAAGAIPHSSPYQLTPLARDRSLLPYQVFMRLASEGQRRQGQLCLDRPGSGINARPCRNRGERHRRRSTMR